MTGSQCALTGSSVHEAVVEAGSSYPSRPKFLVANIRCREAVVNRRAFVDNQLIVICYNGCDKTLQDVRGTQVLRSIPSTSQFVLQHSHISVIDAIDDSHF